MCNIIKICIALINVVTGSQGRNLVTKQNEVLPSRVVGGHPVTDGIIPYQVSIQNTFGEHVCGGSIIAPQWILTAGHCLDWPVQYLKVIMGTNNWTLPYAEYKVAHAEIHCLLNKPTYHNDIGLLRLSQPIAYDERIQPVRLATHDFLKEGDKLLLSGWGSVKAWTHYPDILQKVELSYISHSQCAAVIRNPAWLSEGHICTDTRSGVGSCNGDSGGPLVDENGVQVGVVNFGEPCAVGYPDAFASVSYYYNWIQYAMNGSNKC